MRKQLIRTVQYALIVSLSFVWPTPEWGMRPAHAESISPPSVSNALPVVRKEFPIPRGDKGVLFYVQRSMNPNTIIYSANLLPNGQFNKAEPVQAYWRRFHSGGEAKALDTDERIFAFGVEAEPDGAKSDSFLVNIVSYPKRKARVTLDEKGTPIALADMDGHQVRLIYAYVQLDEGWLMPKVRHVDVFGQDVKTGRYVHQRIKPGDDDKGRERRVR